MNLTVKMLVFSTLGLASGVVSAFPQILAYNSVEYLGGYVFASLSLCIMAVSVNGTLKQRGIKSGSILISNIIFTAFLAVYFLAFTLNPLSTPFDLEQINFEIVGVVSFFICLAAVWNNYRICQDFQAKVDSKASHA